MYDQSTIRRRRAVLGLLVVVSLILLTASFGGTTGGVLGSIQRGFHEVVSPISEGASQAVRPIRDLIGWFGDTFEAKGKVSDLQAQNETLRRDSVAVQALQRQNGDLRVQLDQQRALGISDYGPLGARVVTYDPSVWYARIGISRGSSDGVSVGDPVLAAGGLVGTVSEVSRGLSQVTLITDSTSGVPARVLRKPVAGAQNAVLGIVETSGAGNPSDLLVNYTPPRVRGVAKGDVVVTSGSNSKRFPSLYPPDLPVGEVTRIEDPGTEAQQIYLRPFVNLRGLEFVQVLTQVPQA